MQAARAPPSTRSRNDVDDGHEDEDDGRAGGFMYRRQLNARADLPRTYAFTATINVRVVNSLPTMTTTSHALNTTA